MPDHFHCCDEVDADEAYRRGLAEGMAAGIREPCGHGSDSPIAGCNDPRHDEIEAWYRQALEAGAAPRAEGLERTTENSEPICDIPWLTGPPNAMCLKCGHPFRAHRTEAAQGAAPPTCTCHVRFPNCAIHGTGAYAPPPLDTRLIAQILREGGHYDGYAVFVDHGDDIAAEYARLATATKSSDDTGEPPLSAETFDEADDMCPNCNTPWKCNGPHLWKETAAYKRGDYRADDATGEDR